jgi:hypothetical protein
MAQPFSLREKVAEGRMRGRIYNTFSIKTASSLPS